MKEKSAANSYKVRDLWTTPDRDKVTLILGNILSGAPPLRAQYLDILDRGARAGWTDGELHTALKKLYLANKAGFDACLSGNAAERRLKRMSEVKAALPADFAPASILDIGSGNGAITSGFAAAFASAAGQVYGLDFIKPYPENDNFHHLKYSRKNHIPAAGGTFDLVTAFMVLHHADDPAKLLKEARRVLKKPEGTKPGGLMLVRETDAPTESAVLFNTVMDEILYASLHENQYLSAKIGFRSAAAWEKMFKDTGFKTLHVDRRESHTPFGQTWFLLS